jgi:hypothetical protein
MKIFFLVFALVIAHLISAAPPPAKPRQPKLDSVQSNVKPHKGKAGSNSGGNINKTNVILDKYQRINMNHLFKVKDFMSYDMNQNLLPRVVMLPISESFYETAITYCQEKKNLASSLSSAPGPAGATSSSFSSHFPYIHEHSHDILFYHWLMNHYEKTIVVKQIGKDNNSIALIPLSSSYRLPSSSSSSTVSSSAPSSSVQVPGFSDPQQESDLFFVPTAVKDYREQTISYWKSLDAEIERLSLFDYNSHLFDARKKKASNKQKTNKPKKPAVKKPTGVSDKPDSLSNGKNVEDIIPLPASTMEQQLEKEGTELEPEEEEETEEEANKDSLFHSLLSNGKNDNDTDNVEYESEMDKMKMKSQDKRQERRNLRETKGLKGKVIPLNIPESNKINGSDKELSSTALKSFLTSFVSTVSPHTAAASSTSSLSSASSSSLSPYLRSIDHLNTEDLQSRSISNSLNFNLEKTFLAASYLDQTKNLQYLYHFIRNIRDIHYLRVDNELTPNGRDIYIPYHISRMRYQILTNINASLSLYSKIQKKVFFNSLHHTINHYELYKKRKYFFMVACREPPGNGEGTRHYRTKVYESLKGLYPNTLVANTMTNYQFDYAMFNSDFCFILPGDTSSTSKLYKAIYANCIPVIFISFSSQLPFSSFLEWKKFSILINKDIIKNSKKFFSFIDWLDQLRNYHIEKLFLLKKNIFLISEFFDYDKYDYPSVYHLTLMELQLIVNKDSSLLSYV